eukprot:CAMPEP_0196795456 /NCGR_PEP_ID=MMETSP1104-20130614/36048_1 /TAXON_ID=33652 /ORGANISM="Cafeteria sp., Strain Caron Lab Isolate" /LENGTH=121 /DNA_ID=CAMNT_0042165847 /DNA_START=29 /DNA_END=394 /DNA_ORIENTATION=+
MENLPASASLVDQLDKRVLVILRDGKHVLGDFTSFDQFGNLVLERAVERRFVARKYCDIPLGLYLIRGENVVVLGQLDPEREAAEGLEHVSMEELREAEQDSLERGSTTVQGLWSFMEGES